MYKREMKSSSLPRIAEVQWSSTVESTLWGMVSGMAVVLSVVLGLAKIVPMSLLLGVVVAVGSTVLQAWRGDVPRVLQARVLSWSRPGLLPRVVTMPFEGSAEGKIRRRYGELAAQWLKQC